MSENFIAGAASPARDAYFFRTSGLISVPPGISESPSLCSIVLATVALCQFFRIDIITEYNS